MAVSSVEGLCDASKPQMELEIRHNSLSININIYLPLSLSLLSQRYLCVDYFSPVITSITTSCCSFHGCE